MTAVHLVVPAVAILVLAAVPQQTSLPLGEVQVTGTKRFSAADVTKVSGLVVGQPVGDADFQSAARRMAATGLFKRVGYRYASANGRWVLTFEIEDFDWNVPVTFDNFIWFTDAEIAAALRESVPTFAGVVPAVPEITALITGSLQRLLQAKAIPGRVDFLPEGDLQRLKGYLFRVVDPAPAVCAWTFSGASGIPPQDLEAELTTAGRAYSRTFVTRASKGTVVNLYRRLGYWRATVGEPVTRAGKMGPCDGVSVTMDINEGARYQWAGAEWMGNAALPSAELDRLLGMKRGAAAGLAAIEDGLRRVSGAYGTRGYIAQRATYAERLDDTTHQAIFAITVVEGPQYRLGTVEYAGLAPQAVEELTRRWRMKPGDVYDDSYPVTFRSQEIGPRLPRGTKLPQIQTRADPRKLIVDVRFVFVQ